MATVKSRRRTLAQRARPLAATQTAGSVLQGLIVLGQTAAGKQVATRAQRFFKTEPDGYGAGDRFLGVRMPMLRKMARDVVNDIGEVGIEVALPLLKSGWHEARSLALILLVRRFQKSDAATQALIFRLYLGNTRFINNWDLVDMSAEHIVGGWLADKPVERKSVLSGLAKSTSQWERRIAILATFHAIKRGEFEETLRIARLLLNDDQPLVQKAVGWMLREVGKRVGPAPLDAFLQRYYQQMPRTTLRYAIEHFSAAKRKRYLLGRM